MKGTESSKKVAESLKSTRGGKVGKRGAPMAT